MAVCLLLAACGTDPFALSTEGVRDHRARWLATGITDYEYDYSRDCFCVFHTERPIRVQVRNSRVSSATFSDTGERAGSGSTYPTIDQLFDLIDDAIERKAAGLVVSYHAEYGYPTGIRIDFGLEVDDDEVEIHVRNFTALEQTALREIAG